MLLGTMPPTRKSQKWISRLQENAERYQMLRGKYLLDKSDESLEPKVIQEVKHLIRKDVDRTM
jgi:hypothetical protein